MKNVQQNVQQMYFINLTNCTLVTSHGMYYGDLEFIDQHIYNTNDKQFYTLLLVLFPF
jgi:hypothetical protein